MQNTCERRHLRSFNKSSPIEYKSHRLSPLPLPLLVACSVDSRAFSTSSSFCVATLARSVPNRGFPGRARRRKARRRAASGAMGQAFRKLFDRFFGPVEMRVAMLGLDAAGKTTILYKLHIGEVLSTVPTIGFNVEKVQYKNVVFTVWDVGGQEKLRPLWRHYFSNTDALIYVVDSLDRERIGKAREEFQTIIRDPFMLNSVILVFANKQDLKGAMTPMEVSEGLGLYDLRNRTWHIQGTCALAGDGLYEGLDWLVSALKELQVPGRHLT